MTKKIKDMTTEELYTEALNSVGYEVISNAPLEKQVEDCLFEIADCGAFRNLDSSEVEDLTYREMAIGLINYGRS